MRCAKLSNIRITLKYPKYTKMATALEEPGPGLDRRDDASFLQCGEEVEKHQIL